ncbi:glycosyltransferase family 4 protein [Mesonia ostreae]|uniref:Glycosyltransferase family 4 protein n=1 Tax=Mesonia ostreae TaxID=861110 RepID=A0ABU2KLX7_9FLAO|nr:glycosyltransferase family 4 protein [Mesonia ostreae]MDT0295728.1 glycosyltransferase family 4 protein [Mesonia ostreae]
MKTKTKLLLITSEFPPQPGGIGNHAWQLAKNFAERGFQVGVITDQRSAEGKEEELFDAAQDFEVYRTPRHSPILKTYVERWRKLKQLTKKYDVFIFSGKYSLWMGGALKISSQQQKIAVLHGSELGLSSSLLKKLTLWSIRQMHEVVAVSNYTASLVNELNLKNISVFLNGFEMALPKDIQVPKSVSKNLQLITVGNLSQRKGQHNVVKALPKLLKKFPQLTYHIVGIPTEAEQLITLAQELNVAEHLKIHGQVSEKKKLSLLQDSDVFMMLSEQTDNGNVEGFGIAILEANALALPAIGAKNCGIEDAIDSGKSGVLVDPHRPQEILEALSQIEQEYAIYSLNASNWSKDFSWDQRIKPYLKLIKK